MKRFCPLAMLVLSFVAVATPALANEGVDGPLATLSAGPAGLSFLLTDGPYESYVLTVNGPGELSMRQHFAVGAAPTLSLFDAAGMPLADGTYAYELHATPALSRGLRDELAAARASGDHGIANRLRETGALPTADALVQSGYFSVQNGALIVPDPSVVENEGRGEAVTPAVEDKVAIPLKDQVINDDLIVLRSTCVGFDCANGEDFGSDTIRLKENNLRITFVDTSNNPFPGNDWQLTANDSTSGGANKFSIDDTTNGRIPFTVEARAPSHSLYVDDGGRVGFGTSTPVAEAHIVDGDSATLRLEQNGSSGFAPQTWDVVGNETNFFIRDASNGSTLPFRIRPSAPTDAIYIDGDGDIGLGTASPDQALHVAGGDVKMENSATLASFIIESTAAPGSAWILRANGTNGAFTFTSGGSSPVKITTGGLEVTGSLLLNGSPITPDYVFEPDFPIETIDEHASYMWENKHLPALTPAAYSEAGQGRVDLGALQLGMLEELEKAHVYIDQLNTSLRDKNEELAALKTLTAELAARLAQVEAALN